MVDTLLDKPPVVAFPNLGIDKTSPGQPTDRLNEPEPTVIHKSPVHKSLFKKIQEEEEKKVTVTKDFNTESTVPDPVEPAIETEPISPDEDYILREKDRTQRYKIFPGSNKESMGDVFLAVDLYTNASDKLKFMSRALAYNKDEAVSEKYRNAFAREVRNLVRLQHKRIMPVLDYSEAHVPGDPKGRTRPFFVMPNFDPTRAETLSSIIQFNKPMEIHDGLDMLEQVGEALSYAESMGVTHRDVKPGNLIKDKYYGWIVLDFGIAIDRQIEKDIEGEKADLFEGRSMGTPQYMSPETIRSKTEEEKKDSKIDEKIDQKSDIYSLGTVLFEALTGKKPFEPQGNAFDDMVNILRNPPDLTPLQEIYADNPLVAKLMVDFFGKVLSKDRNLRPENYEEMIKEFKEIVKQYDMKHEMIDQQIESPKEKFDRIRKKLFGQK